MLPRIKQDTQALVRDQERADLCIRIKVCQAGINSKYVMKEVKRERESCTCVKRVRLGPEILKDGHA